ncbi:5'-nucleotidase C-terminal domain-containing protein [Blautia sp. RD014234]|nr:5'-nucleotidase C-terminal domain-containing protein [Blautia parvula]
MLGSGSLRAEEIGPIITVGDLLNMYPYDETLVRIELTGKELKNGILHAMKKVSAWMAVIRNITSSAKASAWSIPQAGRC